MAGTLIGVASYVWRYGIAVMDAVRSSVRIPDLGGLDALVLVGLQLAHSVICTIRSTGSNPGSKLSATQSS